MNFYLIFTRVFGHLQIAPDGALDSYPLPIIRPEKSV